MKNVSFGAVRSYKDSDMWVSKKQYAVDKEIEKVFRTPDCTYDCRTYPNLSCFIEEQTGCDVIIRHKKDGNTEISLFNPLNGPTDKDYPVEKNQNNLPIKTVLNLSQTMSKIKENIQNFVERCRAYAAYGFEEKNDNQLLEAESRSIKENEEDYQRFLAREAALEQLRKEDEIDKEFGIGPYEGRY